MLETTKIENRNRGYFWSYTLEVESVEPPVPPSRASAKTTEKRSVGGNTETYNLSMIELRNARNEVKTGE